jgi:ABC-2 type transport system permease protein
MGHQGYSIASWIAFAVVLVIGIFGDILGLPEWVRSVSPFEHLPRVPAKPVRAVPVASVCGVALALIGAGFAGFSRRDVATT